MLLKIALPVPLSDGCLVYALPEGMPMPRRGARVLVPLQKRETVGLFMASCSDKPQFEIREIKEIWDDSSFLPPDLLDCLEWASRYYMYPLGHVIDEVVPGELLSEKTPRAGRCRRVLNAFDVAGQVQKMPCLNSEQAAAVKAVETAIIRGEYAPFLLHGVTGSGKTEVYLHACERVLAMGKQALILVPEIAMTAQTIARFQARFGAVVSAIHSGLTPAQRRNEWLRILKGEAKIVVGARSAVFAPVWNLGLIVVDEEHDSSYKQEEKFRYSARDIAVMRARISSAVVVLGSATPSLSSYRNAMSERYRLLVLNRRVEDRALPVVRLVNMREDMQNKREKKRRKRRERLEITSDSNNLTWLSQELDVAVSQTLERKEQVLLFLNRRGYASHIFCADCGYVFFCEHCSVSLSWHRKRRKSKGLSEEESGMQGFLLCHYCGKTLPAMPVCPKCQGTNIKTIGCGTERVVDELRVRYPGARVAQLDRDVASAKGYVEEVLAAFREREIDILVGTQMVTKGHDFPYLTLVGVLFADMGLNLPEYNAGERTYQLLSQVAGRAGRAGLEGHVIIQTWLPEHYVMEYVTRHDYVGFYEMEMSFRGRMNYPPFTRMINLLFNSPNEMDVKRAVDYVKGQAEALRMAKGSHYASMEILGPAPSPISRLKNQYRWQLLLKGGQGLHTFCEELIAGLDTKCMRGVRLQVDVDPLSFM